MYIRLIIYTYIFVLTNYLCIAIPVISNKATTSDIELGEFNSGGDNNSKPSTSSEDEGVGYPQENIQNNQIRYMPDESSSWLTTCKYIGTGLSIFGELIGGVFIGVAKDKMNEVYEERRTLPPGFPVVKEEKDVLGEANNLSIAGIVMVSLSSAYLLPVLTIFACKEIRKCFNSNNDHINEEQQATLI